MKPDMRWIRLRAVWLLVIPFLWLARPTPELLAWGGALAALGLAVRSWAAGFIRKEKELTTGGPYAHTRNPLYVGSFLVGVGVTVAGGRWIFVALFLLFFVFVYGRTIRGEADLLEGLFGDRYRHYARHVPLVIPRLTAYRPPQEGRAEFTLSRWRRNREYEAVAGTLAGFAFLAARMIWM
ncbi:MAG TPA: methyltransferase [Longimicrobiales bacterium]|nr:methyltransferase [Longimicrobiales bacterium]